MLVEALDPSPHVTLPVSESLAGAVQVRVAVTLWPACIIVGVAFKVQVGGTADACTTTTVCVPIAIVDVRWDPVVFGAIV